MDGQPSPPGGGSSGRFVPFLAWLTARGRWPVLLLLLLLTAILLLYTLRIPIERSNESMVSRRPAEAEADALFRRAFGSDEDLLLAVTRPDLLSPAGLRYLDSLEKRIAGFEGVRRVGSLVSARRAVAGPAGAESALLIPLPYDAPGLQTRILEALESEPKLAGLLVSSDRRTAALTIELEERPGDDAFRRAIIHALRRLAAGESGEAQLRLTGIAVQKNDVAEYVQRDQALLIPLSVLVLAAILALLFRRLSGVLLPLAVTLVSLVWTLGIYSLAGFSLNTITGLLPPVIIVLAIETSMHLYLGWLRIGESSGDRSGPIARETGALLAPCFFSALTTVLGFLSLTISSTPAVRQFGIGGALGVAASFVVGITLMPLALSFLPLPGGRKPSPALDGLGRLLERLASFSISRPRAILATALLLSLAGLAGLPRIRNNTDLVRFLKASAPLRRDTLFIDRELGGALALEFLLSRNDGRPLSTPEDLGRIAAFQEMAGRQEGVTEVYAIPDLLRSLHRAERGGGGSGLPESEEDLLYYVELLRLDREGSFFARLMTDDLRLARVSVRLRTLGTSEAVPLIREIERQGRELLGESYALVPAGSFYRVAEDSQRLVRSQLASFSLSLVTVMACVHLLFRSWRLTGIALVPNLIPLLLAGGLMGFCGVDLSTATAMIAAVVFGLIVDNTIHYLSRYLREHRGSGPEAIRRTTAGIGRSLAVSALLLVAGFWVGCLGSFKPTIYFSLFTGWTMLVALACNLIVLPACLAWGEPAAGEVRR